MGKKKKRKNRQNNQAESYEIEQLRNELEAHCAEKRTEAIDHLVSKIIKLALVVGFFAFAYFTNPSPEEHLEKLQHKIEEQYMHDFTFSQRNSGSTRKISISKIREGYGEAVEKFECRIKSYLFFSLGYLKDTESGEEFITSLGAFGNVFFRNNFINFR